MTEQKPFHSGFAAIIGRPNVGKSTLMNALIGEKVSIVSSKPQTTRSRLMGVMTGEGWQVVFLDTPGIHTPRSRLGEYMMQSVRDAMDGVELLMVMMDASHLTDADRNTAEKLAQQKTRKLLVLNKLDLIRPEQTLGLMDTFRKMGYDTIVPVSAKTGDGLEDLKKAVVACLPEGPQYFPDDMITDQPERQLCAELIREKALNHLRDEVPHGIGVEMMAMNQVRDDLMEIHATIYCERDAHKGIIIGRGGAMLRTIGSEARVDIERLLGQHVDLQLWVKVRPDWRNRPEDLRNLGYDAKR